MMSFNVIEKVTGSCDVRSIFSEWLLHTRHSISNHDTALTHVMARPFTLIQSQSCKVALVRESHFRLSLTLFSRPFLLQVVNFPVLHRLAAALLK